MRPFRADEWLLYDQSSPSACGGRALVQGKIYHRDGTMVAAVAQEGLTRYRRGSTAFRCGDGVNNLRTRSVAQCQLHSGNGIPSLVENSAALCVANPIETTVLAKKTSVRYANAIAHRLTRRGTV